MFPNYLFIESIRNTLHTTTINATYGISHFTRLGSLLIIIFTEVIQELRNHSLDNVTEPGGEVHSMLLLLHFVK